MNPLSDLELKGSRPKCGSISKLLTSALCLRPGSLTKGFFPFYPLAWLECGFHLMYSLHYNYQISRLNETLLSSII